MSAKQMSGRSRATECLKCFSSFLEARCNLGLGFAALFMLAFSPSASTETNEALYFLGHPAEREIIDSINLGVPESEEEHDFTETGSERMDPGSDPEEHNWNVEKDYTEGDVIALGEWGRRLKPHNRLDPSEVDEERPGSWMAFDIAVDPERQNYITIRLWGSETAPGGLGMKAGLGEEERRDHRALRPIHRGNWGEAPMFPGRWIYRTVPLPFEDLTQGNERVRVLVQGAPARFSATLYNAYTHTDSYFVPPEDERQGEPFVWGPGRPKPEGFDLEKALEENAMAHIERVVNQGTQARLTDLARIYTTEWSGYYRDENIIETAARILDGRARQFARDGHLGMRWIKPGRLLGWPYYKMHEGFEKAGLLEEEIELAQDSPKVTRREAYADMFKGEMRIHDRRMFTNQTAYSNTGLYYFNRALKVLQPEAALPEVEARALFAYELLGMMPFGKGGMRFHGVLHDDRIAVGYPWFVVTDKGLTREPGFTGNYGDRVMDFAILVDRVGDPFLKQRAIETAQARHHFRIPENTPEGYPTLRREGGTYSHRVAVHPGTEMYGRLDAFHEAAILQNPSSLRLAELFLKHGHLHERIDKMQYHPITRLEHYRVIKELLPTDYRLPWEPDFQGGPYAWADEMNGMVVIRHGDDMIWCNLMISGGTLMHARLRHATPRIDRIVNARLAAAEPGEWESPPAPGGGTLDLWLPDHRERFYQLSYYDFLIGMNTTRKHSYKAGVYEMDIPEAYRDRTALDLISGMEFDLSRPLTLPPRTTVVLYVGDS